jgi:SAM-dependent methyltransferase
VLPFRSHTGILAETVRLAGTRALDVGCGDGRLVRWLGSEGADALGLEPDPTQLARAAATVGPGVLIRAGAERLPFRAAAFDLVLFFNSLHHVPAVAEGLAEAARVLRPGGDLVVVEPLAEGAWFELLRPLEDETSIRAHAYEVLLGAADARGLTPVRELAYTSRVEVASLPAAVERLLAANPERRSRLGAEMPELERRFAALGAPTGRGFAFAQPMRLNHLRRAA